MTMSDTNFERRDFMKSTALLAATAGVMGAGAMLLRAEEHATKMKKALGQGMIASKDGEKALTLDERMAAVKEAGFDGVELNSPGITDRDAWKKALDNAGLQVSEIVDSAHWGKPFSSASDKVREEGAGALKIALEDAKFFGATSVLLVPAVVNKQIRYDDAYARSHAEIKKMLPVAKDLGVKIAIENVWNDFLLSPLEAARYIDEFESEWVGAHFDIGNVAVYGYPEQWIKILGKRILKLHVKEFSRSKAEKEGKWKGFAHPLGDKEGIDWPAVAAALKDIGYTGWATAEFGAGSRASMKDAAERMDKVLELK